MYLHTYLRIKEINTSSNLKCINTYLREYSDILSLLEIIKQTLKSI